MVLRRQHQHLSNPHLTNRRRQLQQVGKIDHLEELDHRIRQ